VTEPCPTPPSRAALAAAFAAIYGFWGVSFLAIRYAVLDGVPPLLVITLRCAGGAAILYAWLGTRGAIAPARPGEWRTAALAGAFLFVAGHSVMAWAEQRVSSGETSLFLATIPLWLVGLSATRERRAPDGRVLTGLALGMAGVAVLSAGSGTWSGSVWDRLALLGCACAWAVGSLVARDGRRPASAAQSTAMQLAAGAVAVVMVGALTGNLGSWDWRVTPRAAVALAFLVIGATVLAFAAYTWLLRVSRPAVVGTYAFVNPVIALAVGWSVGDDRLTPRTLVAAVLVVAAVVLTRPRTGPRPGR